MELNVHEIFENEKRENLATENSMNHHFAHDSEPQGLFEPDIARHAIEMTLTNLWDKKLWLLETQLKPRNFGRGLNLTRGGSSTAATTIGGLFDKRQEQLWPHVFCVYQRDQCPDSRHYFHSQPTGLYKTCCFVVGLVHGIAIGSAGNIEPQRTNVVFVPVILSVL